MVLAEEFNLLLARLMIIGGVFVAFVLLFVGIRIPYGRYHNESWLANVSKFSAAPASTRRANLVVHQCELRVVHPGIAGAPLCLLLPPCTLGFSGRH